MARLIEIKAHCHDWDAMNSRLSGMTTAPSADIQQDDTFFACANGRLKLRELAPDRGRLIFYRRSDGAGAKQTDFLVSKTDSPASLRECLALAHGVIGRVRKARTIFELPAARVHLDRVAGLGSFVEIEVLMEDGVDAARGEAVISLLMSALSIETDDLLSGSYLDLLATHSD
ncbi:MAG: adenylate cyclase [Burkholderiales bacterium PBB2]|jgi:predicted adenylyl cyclase CyaB|nr:MAG: adenylate cyclase [Burkholderiales bacterium PBB2]